MCSWARWGSWERRTRRMPNRRMRIFQFRGTRPPAPGGYPLVYIANLSGVDLMWWRVDGVDSFSAHTEKRMPDPHDPFRFPTGPTGSPGGFYRRID